MSAPDSPEQIAAIIAECMAAVSDAHETVVDASIEWPEDAPVAVLHELDNAADLLSEAEQSMKRAAAGVSS